MTTRRALLATLGALPLPGCIASDDPGDGSGDPSATPDDGPEPPARIDSSWPMPAADVGGSNHASGAAGPTSMVGELWSMTLEAPLSGPVLADGTVYVGDADGSVRSVDARTGEAGWQQSVEPEAGTPWVMDGSVFVPTADSVHALAAGDGTQQWSEEARAVAEFLVAPHGVYYVTGETEPTLVGLDPDDGSERWRTNFAEPWAGPLFADDGHVFVPSGTHDSFPWIFAADSGEFVGDRRPERGADFAAEQFLHDGVVYAADGFFGRVRAERLTAEGYTLRWDAGIDAYVGFELAGGGDRVYFQAEAGEEPGLYALSTGDGAEAWVNDGVKAIVGRPVVADEAVLVLTDDALRCFDPADGSERWSYPRDGVGRRFIVADDLVFTSVGETLRALRSV